LNDTPIACSLSGPDLAARKAATATIARAALRRRELIADGRRLHFTGGEDVEDQLRDIVAAESACCPFLTLRLHRDGDALRLEVTGPAEAQPIIEELFA
jgi:hypothetical protein